MRCISGDDIRLTAARRAGLSSVACWDTSGTCWDTGDSQIIWIAPEASTGQDFRYVIGAAEDHRCLTIHKVSDCGGDRTTISRIYLRRHHSIPVLQFQQEF